MLSQAGFTKPGSQSRVHKAGFTKPGSQSRVHKADFGVRKVIMNRIENWLTQWKKRLCVWFGDIYLSLLLYVDDCWSGHSGVCVCVCGGGGGGYTCMQCG